MAEAKKPKLPIITSPRVRLSWPKLNEPDFGTKDYPKPDGEFSTKGIMSADDPAARSFLNKLEELAGRAEAEAKELFKGLKAESRKKLGGVKMNPVFTELLDEETEEPTGELEFKFARKASGEYKKGPKAGKKWHAKVPIFDARGNLLKNPPKIGGGTIAKVSFEPSIYFIPGTGAAGVKLNLEAVQIITLRTFGERDAKGYGFGAEEDGDEIEDGNEGFQDETGGDEDEGGEGAETPDF